MSEVTIIGIDLTKLVLNEPADAGVVSGLAGMASRWEGLVAQDQPFIRRPSDG